LRIARNAGVAADPRDCLCGKILRRGRPRRPTATTRARRAPAGPPTETEPWGAGPLQHEQRRRPHRRYPLVVWWTACRRRDRARRVVANLVQLVRRRQTSEPRLYIRPHSWKTEASGRWWRSSAIPHYWPPGTLVAAPSARERVLAEALRAFSLCLRRPCR